MAINKMNVFHIQGSAESTREMWYEEIIVRACSRTYDIMERTRGTIAVKKQEYKMTIVVPKSGYMENM